jgi:hypothetical protein
LPAAAAEEVQVHEDASSSSSSKRKSAPIPAQVFYTRAPVIQFSLCVIIIIIIIVSRQPKKSRLKLQILPSSKRLPNFSNSNDSNSRHPLLRSLLVLKAIVNLLL